MSQSPATPVKVPAAAAKYTPATLDGDLRSQINTHLLQEGHISKIQEAILHALNAHSSDWPATIQSHALDLLRSGEVTTFPNLLRRVLDDVAEGSTAGAAGAAKPNGKATNGVNGSAAAADEAKSLAVPEAVVEEALKVTRESLNAVITTE